MVPPLLVCDGDENTLAGAGKSGNSSRNIIRFGSSIRVVRVDG
jgi:hypothetical protein